VWSVGFTPFGLFSDELRLSFAITDGVAKAAVLSQVAATLQPLSAALERATVRVAMCRRRVLHTPCLVLSTHPLLLVLFRPATE
jgi:hypothetical protein